MARMFEHASPARPDDDYSRKLPRETNTDEDKNSNFPVLLKHVCRCNGLNCNFRVRVR
jgi:hypothetical protein